MTDAGVRVTQSVVESFTEQYLQSVGCTIDKHGPKWDVTLEDDSSTDVLDAGVTLVCDTGGDISEDEVALHPESSFFQRLLDEASQRAPVGALSIDAEATDTVIPDWLQNSEVTVEETEFVPYYDRTAAVILFQISIETVSEYQQQFLRSVALDTRSEEVLPKLDERFLELTEPGTGSVKTETADVGEDRLRTLIDAAREPVVADIQPALL